MENKSCIPARCIFSSVSRNISRAEFVWSYPAVNCNREPRTSEWAEEPTERPLVCLHACMVCRAKELKEEKLNVYGDKKTTRFFGNLSGELHQRTCSGRQLLNSNSELQNQLERYTYFQIDFVYLKQYAHPVTSSVHLCPFLGKSSSSTASQDRGRYRFKIPLKLEKQGDFDSS